MQRLRERGRVVDEQHNGWRLVFVPISVTFETHRPEDFFQALAVRLAEILGAPLQSTPSDPAVQYADRCQQMAEAAATSGPRTLIVIDGIDEALGESFHTWWFPRNRGSGLRLVLSARWKGDDEDSSGWLKRLDWDQDVRVRTRELSLISIDGVRDVLINLGAPNRRPCIAARDRVSTLRALPG